MARRVRLKSRYLRMEVKPYDILRDTEQLRSDEFGVLTRLRFHCWLQNGTLPDEDIALARFGGVSLAMWNEIKPRMQFFFEVWEGVWKDPEIVNQLYAHSKPRMADVDDGDGE